MKRWLALVAVCWPSAVFAEGWEFLENSPGPLVRGHHDLDRSDGCKKCHVLGKGVEDKQCLECHEEITKSSLHETFGKEKCAQCHTDHKGRAAVISDWERVGGRRTFDHKQTKFTLTGLHQKVACTKCHQKKLASGRTTFTGLDPTCAGCHGNTHRFSSKELLGKCVDCHGEGGARRELKNSELFFNHGERTGLPLIGKHAEAKCRDCHRGANMSMEKKRDCAGCHAKDSPHGKSFARADCNQCHAIDVFSKPTFSHEKTKFPLRGLHDTKRCSKCHESPKDKPAHNCEGCHGDPHRERFASLSCAKCHGLGGKTKVDRFDHAKEAKFALTGKHKSLSCRNCHAGKGPLAFERQKPGSECRGCHTHEKAHDGQFDDKLCTSCHVEGGSKQLEFDHQTETRFPLVGIHQKVECAKCHEGGNYRNSKLACKDCHEDSHQGQLGDKCERCHSPEVEFKKTEFDHDRQSRFELVGLHEKVECAKCHPERRYKTDQMKCVDCHFDDDPHQSQLGTECQQCHVPEKGAPKFDHGLMTSFALTGRHEKTECARCHQPKPVVPPSVGWTAAVPLPKLDLHFPKMGEACADCHFDVHEGGYGKDCAGCHDTASFQTSRAVHDTGAFRLMGRHDQLACISCHTDQRKLTGIGAQCFVCHQKDDAHNNALGFECGSCHQQEEWLPARFNHSSVGYPLRGMHAAAQCRDCHRIGVYAGTPRECTQCHGNDAIRVADPPHGAEMMECETCHGEVTFTPARVNHTWYPLVGAHVTNRCTSCHLGGRYLGTPRDCIGCHEADYVDPRKDPNHVVEAYSTDCLECHSQITWLGARRP